ncbi:MAG: hypothetical protein HJJLKODD_02069 [Phycisphaerae bacterium]|nr:hypothetical protein [Phycisphaerae bacterium]
MRRRFWKRFCWAGVTFSLVGWLLSYWGFGLINSRFALAGFYGCLHGRDVSKGNLPSSGGAGGGDAHDNLFPSGSFYLSRNFDLYTEWWPRIYRGGGGGYGGGSTIKEFYQPYGITSFGGIWIPFWMPALFFTGMLCFLYIRPFYHYQRYRNYERGLCPECGYDTRSNRMKCSECGYDLIPQ